MNYWAQILRLLESNDLELIRQNSIAPYQTLFYSNSDLLTVGFLISGKSYFKRLEDYIYIKNTYNKAQSVYLKEIFI